ncbi:AraC family transcriptional regulator [Streptomyces sp. B6B3]|uniref:helix-turn-helix domain-containing protein n=1 Tax=Streptomyces sp. B6B3 TaxID=3153570 RepID=UPI00325C95B8
MGHGERARWSRVRLSPGAPPLDLMTARFERHCYAPHVHEEFSIGVCLSGLEHIDYRRGRLLAGPGTIVILEPDEPHTGSAARPGGFAYRAFYPAAGLLTEGVRGRPYFRDGVVQDEGLAAALARAHRAATGEPDPLRWESEVVWLLAALVRRHAAPDSARPVRTVSGGEHVARVVRERLADQPRTPPTLAEIAADLGLSRYQVLRAFRTSTGMPPYAWLAQHRVARARALLAAGRRPAEVAELVGFADQAHLTRWFRRVTGVTPGAYRNSVQDNV